MYFLQQALPPKPPPTLGQVAEPIGDSLIQISQVVVCTCKSLAGSLETQEPL